MKVMILSEKCRITKTEVVEILSYIMILTYNFVALFLHKI